MLWFVCYNTFITFWYIYTVGHYSVLILHCTVPIRVNKKVVPNGASPCLLPIRLISDLKLECLLFQRIKKFSFSAMPRTALNYCKAEWSSWQERVEEECWVKLSNVQDSAESSWVQIRTAMSKEECWVKLSNVRDSAESSWVQIGTAPSKEELSPGRMYTLHMLCTEQI